MKLIHKRIQQSIKCYKQHNKVHILDNSENNYKARTNLISDYSPLKKIFL